MEETNVREGIRRDYAGDLFEHSSIENTEPTVEERSAFVRPLGKYAPLAWHLRGLEGRECLLKFSEVEKIIGSGLPRSAVQQAHWMALVVRRYLAYASAQRLAGSWLAGVEAGLCQECGVPAAQGVTRRFASGLTALEGGFSISLRRGARQKGPSPRFSQDRQ